MGKESSIKSKGGGGTLFVCPTPIGNLEDITLRVLRILREVDIVAAEDTRVTGRLLARFEISKPLVSYREFGERRRIESLLADLASDRSVALVSDAGTPGLSDPGHKLIRAAIEAGFRVEVLPGPSALVTALVASGLPTDSFVYQGFLPRKAGERRKLLAELLGSGRTVVIYESPHRIMTLLKEVALIDEGRRVAVARELTKKFEELVRGTAAQVGRKLQGRARGEIVVVIDRGHAIREEFNSAEIRRLVEERMLTGVPKKDAIPQIARETGAPRRAVYDAAKEIKVTF
ncbi:MAG: 16S rRNA (cytidine(1402)-2'-O)-methyltransferase [Chloroflexi bacterium]|nr:16S rRNA (cytidine(1402)-2'-O)-methyltransferase [Chloroflexota bacterium]